MAVGLSEPENLLPVAGVELAAISAGIKANQQDDLVLLKLEQGSCCAAVFTRNAFCAAPVIIAREHLKLASPRALLINSGNANAGTGEQGLEDARQSCALVAEVIGCEPQEVLPFSTGVIGENLPMQKLQSGIARLPGKLGADNWLLAARGIMTTDTLAKAVSSTVTVDATEVTITGIAKGAGMIRPDMATMLAFISTDATVEPDWLQQCLHAAVKISFNCITVDGDTSTNDACILTATGASGSRMLAGECDDSKQFVQVLTDVCTRLAQAIVRDGEGASKFVTIIVDSAADEAEARRVAYTIAHSPLVKTALFASDPNWGRILAAVGRAALDDLDIDTIRIFLDDVCIVSNGGRDAAYQEDMGQQVMSQDEITIRVELNRGEQQATVWTSDLSYDYVKINAEYRT